MANSKISALPSATTPLAGTETLPVVQSSSTRKVSVADLTAGRAVAAASLETTGKVGVSVTAASGIGQLSNTNTAWAGGNATDGFVWRSVQNDWTATVLGTPASGAGYGLRLHTLGTTTSDYPLFISSGTSAGTAKFTVQGDGTTTFTGGNLVQGTAAKGVNFTANTPAAGMTSQLLNWYEVGNWTPSFSDSGGGTPTQTSTGRYTRIGNVVHFWFKCSLSVPATDLYYTTNFPFTPAVTQIAGTAGLGGTSDKIYPVTGINDGRLRAFVTATMSAFEGCGAISV